MGEYIDYFVKKFPEIMRLLLEHVGISALSVGIAVLVGVPAGLWISRNEKLASLIIGFANTVQALPSVALLGFLIPFFGIGERPAVIMIVLYTILPVLKNTHAGVTSVDRSLLDVGTGMGMSPLQLLLRVQLPMAMPIIMAGVRVCAVTAVGYTTLAALIGAGGLGQLIYRGLFMVNGPMILAGALPAMLLTLIVDSLLKILENLVVPRGLKI